MPGMPLLTVAARRQRRQHFGHRDSIPVHLQNVINAPTEAYLREKFESSAKRDGGSKRVLLTSALGAVLRECGLNPTEALCQEYVEEYDLDGDGGLSFSEFVDLWYNLSSDESDFDKLLELFQKAFEYFDRDRSGAIDMNEFKIVMMELGDKLSVEECNTLFSILDANGDGVVNWSEFSQFLKDDREETRRKHAAKGVALVTDNVQPTARKSRFSVMPRLSRTSVAPVTGLSPESTLPEEEEEAPSESKSRTSWRFSWCCFTCGPEEEDHAPYTEESTSEGTIETIASTTHLDHNNTSESAPPAASSNGNVSSDFSNVRVEEPEKEHAETSVPQSPLLKDPLNTKPEPPGSSSFPSSTPLLPTGIPLRPPGPNLSGGMIPSPSKVAQLEAVKRDVANRQKLEDANIRALEEERKSLEKRRKAEKDKLDRVSGAKSKASESATKEEIRAAPS